MWNQLLELCQVTCVTCPGHTLSPLVIPWCSVCVPVNFVRWQLLVLGLIVWFFVSGHVSTVSSDLALILWDQSSYPSPSCSRLRRWVLHEAHGHGAVPEEPPAHQRDPERECGARRPLRGHHSQNASPETPGSVFNGSSGKEKGCGCSCNAVGLGSAPRLGSFDHLRDCSCCLSMFCVLQEIIPGISWELQNVRLHLLCCFVLEDRVKLYFVLWDVPSLSSIVHFYTQPSVCSVKVWWLISTGRVLISDTWQLTLFVIILFYFPVNCPYANIFHWKLNLY